MPFLEEKHPPPTRPIPPYVSTTIFLPTQPESPNDPQIVNLPLGLITYLVFAFTKSPYSLSTGSTTFFLIKSAISLFFPARHSQCDAEKTMVSILTGLLGGGLSILAAILLIKPLNVLVKRAIYQYNFYLLSSTTFDLGGFRWWVAPILIGLALVTAVISALIPAIIASRKDPAKAINE